MTSSEIVKIMAKRLGMTEKAAREQLRNKLVMMAQHLKSQGALTLPGLGTLAIGNVKAHRAYNPARRCYVTRPAQKRFSLKTEKEYREYLKQLQHGSKS